MKFSKKQKIIIFSYYFILIFYFIFRLYFIAESYHIINKSYSIFGFNTEQKEVSFNFWKFLKFFILDDQACKFFLTIFVLIFTPLFFYFFKVKDKIS
ncbi:hypothetical protein [Candidatus Phytoplasma sp. AldY-WA1]|uniref:hypothetical protein n=1 Tax=Candidatus Phytoplasma sp. AldY-WA1 TaxID=2852100 RepID=UPI00254AD6CE|nr:hypothetical protein [Candidatus Phytoplasma sp. AldY-WA1]